MNTFRRYNAGRNVCWMAFCLLLLCGADFAHAEVGHPAKVPSLVDIGGPLLNWVNLGRSELEEARTLLAEGRRREALQSLLRYFRQSPRPRLSEETPKPNPLADTTVADEILLRQITIGNVTLPLDRWDQIDSKNPEWNWGMQRHAWWLDVAQAYFDTGDERYAVFLNGMILDWFLSNPRPAEDVLPFGTKPKPTAWRTFDVGTRLADSWPKVFLYLRSSPSLSDEALAAFLRSCHEQAECLVAYPKAAKWLLVESAGLLTTAVLYPEFRKAEEWRDTANMRLESLTGDQILPDGSHIEGSVQYLVPCLARFAQAAYLQRINGLDPPEVLGLTARLGIFYTIGISEPSFFLPAVNDCDRLYLLDVFEKFGESLPQSSEIEYIHSERSQGYPPAATSFYYPFAGDFVFRNSWERDALYAFFDVGIFGNAYAHEDRLQFEVAAFGETLLGDMGRSTRKPGPARDYFMGTEAHNCILIDGRGMDFRSEAPSKWVNRRPLRWPCHLEGNVQWAQATYDGPWQGRISTRKSSAPPPFRWTRRFTFVEPSNDLPGFWVVSDSVDGKGSHRIAQLLNFYPGQCSVDDASHRVFFQRNGVNLVVESLAKTSVDISMVEGQDRPFRGWFSPALGTIESAPSVRITGNSPLPVRRDFLMMPHKIGEACPLISARLDDGRVICETTTGTVEVPVLFTEMGGQE